MTGRDKSTFNPLSAYLGRISRDDLLTHREEIELGRHARAGDRLARRVLIERNLRLVVSVAAGYRRSGVPLEDLIQEGNIGLIEAVERFDPEKGFRFSSYAVWRIRKSVQKAVAAQSRIIRLPRGRQEQLEALGRASGELRAELGREPDAEESASRLGWTASAVRATQNLPVYAGSLDRPSGPADDAPTLSEFVADETVPDVPDAVVRRLELDWLKKTVAALPERARHVVVRRYGLDGREPAGLAELAAELGISRQGVSQLQHRSVRRLKAC